ncbi:discoidin domain-containing protein [[Ruminococcus] torques]|uniref:discoidin domain-containing protein n=5 Tax=Bacillota TaxID=1239 RepID=UPI003AB96E0E
MKKKFFSAALAAAMVVTSVFSTTSVAGAAENETAVPYGKVTVEQKDNTVTIGNGAIERIFSTADKKLSTTEIVNKRTGGEGTTFTPQKGSEEFVVKTTKEKKDPITLPGINRTGWEATADSYQNASGDSDGPASNLLDGRTESIWHSNYGGAGQGDQDYPHNVVITFGKDVTFQSFSYTPRKEGENTNGNIKGYELYASTASEKLDYASKDWGEPIAKGNFEYNGVNPIYVNLKEACTAKQIKFVATSSNNGERFAGGAEFNLHAEKAPIDTDDRAFETSDLELKDGNEAVKVEDTTATINGKEKTGKKVTFSFKPYTHKNVEYSIDEVIVMYEGDHFMRKFLEIDVPDDKMADAEIDYIDLESLKVAESDAQWTIPRGQGGVVQMEEFKANLGQPIYIQGMFFGCEFPAADTEIVNGTGFMRYYSGKTFSRLKEDNQLTTDDKYVTWQTVAGAARSTEQEVIQADFFEYIKSIATPSEFRTQYNSWFDNMMKISDENILASFIEIDRELNKAEVRPLDSYVVDDGWNAYNDGSIGAGSHAQSGAIENTEGFWTFNEKFPEGLTPSSELVKKFGSNFGVWVGPRGGYNFYTTLANIIERAQKGSKAGHSIDVADRVYVENFKKMAIKWQQDWDVNYWKWDGFADTAQYNHFNNLGGADGVPVYSESNHHMTGGYHQMYHVTDLWEAWIDLMEAVRQSEKEDGINKLWISLTCYVNPSPWYLQWANSVWIQCVHDQKDASFGTTKMNKQITYRDACYYDFLKNHQFQFPLQNLYNHDPIYGKEGTGMTVNTATDEDFQNYLYMLSTRGTAFWELYYSDSIMTDGKYEITGEFLEWAEENYHMLKNSKMIGGKPDITKLGNGDLSDQTQAEAYGFSCFDGTDGIISLRNPSANADKTIKFTFDRTMGVAEGAGTLNYYLEHSYLLSDKSAQTGTLKYGQEYTVNLKPNEVRILRVSAEKDTTAPKIDRIMTDGAKELTVKFDEKVSGNLFKVENAKVSSIKKSADDTTYHIVLAEAPANEVAIKVTPQDIKDMSGNKATEAASVVYHKDSVIVEKEDITEAGEIAAADKSLNSNNGFTVYATVQTTATNQSLVKQNDQYELKVTADGKASFTLNGATAVSDKSINDGVGHKVVGVKENNGMLKLYVDGTLEGSAYNKENRFHTVEKAAISVGENVSAAAVYDIAYGYDEVAKMGEPEGLPKLTLEDSMITVSGTTSEAGVNKANVLDGNNTTYWTSQDVTEGTVNSDNAWLKVDLGATYKLDQVDYTPRYYNGAQNYWACTGNIKKLIVEISKDGQTWTSVTGESGLDLSSKITNTNDLTFFPEEITFDAQEARYVRISGTSSYHWQEGSQNKSITVGDLAIYGEKVEAKNIAKDADVTAKWTADGTDAAKGGDRPMTMAVDGNKTDYASNYAEFGADGKRESSYMQVNLGDVCDVNSLSLYRYWGDSRIYQDTVVAVAEKETDFAEGKATIVYNADDQNVHKLYTQAPEKFDEDYAETAQGKSWTLPEGTKAQFVRVYMYGRKDNATTTNHVVELEVYGTKPEEGEKPGVDITALIDRLAELSAVDTSNATTDSAAAFKALVKEGYDLVATGAQTQEEVTAMIEKLKGAEDKLVDASALRTAIADAEEKVETSTVSSAEPVKAKIAEAKQLLVNGTKDAIDAMVAELTEAVKGLVARGDVTDLKALIDQYAKENLKAEDHTTSTWSAYETALNAADAIVTDNSNSDQAAVDAAKKVLEDAHAALAKRGNTDALKALIEEYKELKEADYTHETWVKYEEALEAANGIVADNSNKTQAEVDAAKDALKAAKEALVKAPVDPQLDKSKLQAAVDAAKAKDENAYTTASYNAMEKVLAEAEELLTNGKDQAAIDAKAKDLNDAVAALVERGNTDALKALIAEYKAEGLKEADYTTDSWKAYTDALTAAEKVVKDNSNLDQAAVDAAKKALEDAHTALVKVEQINKEALKAAIDAAKAADANLYTTDSYKAMKTVLSDAEKVLKDSKDQTEIDAAAKALNDAVTALVQRGNTDALKALIEEYKDLKEADYTADSWKEYADALKAAKAIVEDNSNSDQAAVDAALNALRDARVALKLSGKPSVDKSELQAAYDKYKDKKNDGYTAESWAKFENALKSAKAILDNEAATADQVKAALAQLNSAAEGLTKTQTPPKNDPQTPSTPSQGGSVQTGDTAHVALWLVLAGMSVIAYVAVRRKRA